MCEKYFNNMSDQESPLYKLDLGANRLNYICELKADISCYNVISAVIIRLFIINLSTNCNINFVTAFSLIHSLI